MSALFRKTDGSDPKNAMPGAVLRPLGRLAKMGPLAVTGREVHIGRLEKNDLVIPETTVSGHHATLVFKKGGFFISDEKSLNKTYINGVACAPKKPLRLKPGDLVAFDVHEFVFIPERPAIASEYAEEVDGKSVRPIMCPTHPAWKADRKCAGCGVSFCRYCLERSGGKELCAACRATAPEPAHER